MLDSPPDGRSPAASLAYAMSSPWPGLPMAATTAVHHLLQQVPLDLWLVTEVVGGEQQVVAAAGEWAAVALPGTTFCWADSFCVRMVEGRGPQVAPDIAQVPDYAQIAVGERAHVQCYVGVPLLRADGELFGTLCGFAGSPRPAAIVEALPLVSFAAGMIGAVLAVEAVAAERAQVSSYAQTTTERDRLTGLRNDRGWQYALKQENERCRRYGSNASVIALDVNVGELDLRPGYGDAVLLTCGQALSAACRPSDIVARCGGAGFGVIALECDAACARALLVRVRRSLRSAGVPVSVGVATRRVGEDLEGTWQRADEAMLVGKRRLRQLRDVQLSRQAREERIG